MRSTDNQIVYEAFTGSRIRLLNLWIDDLTRLLPQLSSSAPPVTHERIDTMMNVGTTSVFVAFDGRRIVGIVLLCRTELLVGTKDWIEDVVVDEAYRGHGIMTKLMEMAEQHSFATGADSVNLTSNPSRVAARAGYEKRGYQLRDTGVFRLKRSERE